MRLRREDWPLLHPDDVAWVTEWQLACGFPWIPIGEVPPVTAAPTADPGGRTWTIWVRAGRGMATAMLPVRDLALVIAWCHTLHELSELSRPTPRVRSALRMIRSALDQGLTHLDPLNVMGYAPASAADSEER